MYICENKMTLLHYLLFVISLTVLTVKTINAKTYANDTCDDFSSTQSVSIFGGVNISFAMLATVDIRLLQIPHLEHLK